MYTYLIVSILSLIALSCIFKNKEKNGSIYFTWALLVIAISLITTVVINLIRADDLKTEEILWKTRELSPIEIYEKTIYRKTDTIKTDDGYNITYKNSDKPFDDSTNVIITKENYNYYAKIISDSIQVLRIKDNDSIFYSFDLNKVTFVDTLNTKIRVYADRRIGDKWTVGWTLPKINRKKELIIYENHIKDIENLNKKNVENYEKQIFNTVNDKKRKNPI